MIEMRKRAMRLSTGPHLILSRVWILVFVAFQIGLSSIETTLAAGPHAAVIVLLEERGVVTDPDKAFNIAPLVDGRDFLAVDVIALPQRLVEMDVRRSTLFVIMDVTVTWHNQFAVWNPEHYSGVRHVILPSKNTWTPNLALYTGHDTFRDGDQFVRISNTGRISSFYCLSSNIPCDTDTANFPLEEAACSFQIRPFIEYNIDLRSSNLFNSSFNSSLSSRIASEGAYQSRRRELYVENLEWSLQRISVQRVLRDDDDDGDGVFSLTYLKYRLILHRRFTFFAFALIMPSVLLSSFTLVIFCLPATTTEKVNFGFGLFLSYTFLLMIIVDVTPPSGGDFPLLGKYFSINILLLAVSIFTEIILRNVITFKRKRMSSWKKAILRALARILLLIPANQSQDGPRPHRMTSQTRPASPKDQPTPAIRACDYVTPEIPIDSNETQKSPYDSTRDCDDYELLVRVVDRFLLVLFCAILITAGCVIFAKLFHKSDVIFSRPD